MLFGCIHVPGFAIQAALRYEVNAGAVALLDGPDSMLKVVACNTFAREAGVATGMTKLQAEVCPGVTLRRRLSEDEVDAHEALLACGYGFSPRVESTVPGTIVIDLTGAERLLGIGRAVGQQMEERTRAIGFDVNIGIAANPDAALCAARGFTGTTVIAQGEEALRLGDLALEALEPTPEVLDIFAAWGIHDCKSLAALPAVPLTQRLGQYGLHLQRLAQGAIHRELISAESPVTFHESTELEEPVELLEPLSFILNRLLEQLTFRLRTKSLATDRIELELFLEVHPDRELKALSSFASVVTIHQRTVKLPVPTQDAKVLLKLLQLDLAAHPPQAPVKQIKIEAIPARIRLTQTGLFQPLAPEPAKLEITLSRLRAVVGEQDAAGRLRVGFPATVDSPHPHRFEVLPFIPELQIKSASPPSLLLALRVFRPPVPARVELGSGRPVDISFHRVKAKVIHASGPWRNSGEWWDAAGEWRHDEWDVQVRADDSVGLYRIFRDLLTEQWFVDGMYD